MSAQQVVKVGIYARVSTDAQEARGTIGSQLEALHQRPIAVAQRRIAFQQPSPLKLGQRVEVKIVEATSPKDGEPRATISSTRTIPPKRK